VTPPEIRQMLSNCRAEIIRLRQERDVLRGKVEVMDLFSAVLHTAVAVKPATESDLVWDIDLALRGLDGRANDALSTKHLQEGENEQP